MAGQSDHGAGRRAVLHRLPHRLALALRMKDLDVPDSAIAAELSIEVEAVPPLLELAEAKLARLMSGVS